MSPRRPVRRRVVLLGAGIGLICLVAAIWLAEGLRYPHPDVDAVVGDRPELQIDCPERIPREGMDRENAELLPELEVRTGDLHECPEHFDAERVRFTGEVVGVPLPRSGGTWVQVNDDDYALDVGPLPTHQDFRGGNSGIGVWLPDDLADRITRSGRWGSIGDIVEVSGTFHRVDPDSGEIAVVHAARLRVEQVGQPVTEDPLRNRQVAAAVLAVLALLLVGVERLRAARR